MRRFAASAKAWVAALGLMAIAFVFAWRTTRDLAWPNEHDLYREMASAQSLLREGYGHDPCYLGERTWYNPLTHIALAVFQRVTGWELSAATARAGAFLNLLGPVSFFLMAMRLLGRRRAVMALVSYLFCIGGSFPSWSAATYSPWLYPVNFAQGFFYLLIFQLAALRDRPPGWGWALVTGCLWGLCFLAHTAPALLFGAILAALVIVRGIRVGSAAFRHGMIAALAMAVGFVIVIFPYAASIVGHYSLRIVNPIPNGYVPDFLGYRHIPFMLARHIEPPVLVVWVGLFLVVRGRAAPFVRALLLAWFSLAAAYLAYGYAVAGVAKLGLHWPLIIPSYHALFYLKASFSPLFAIGIDALARGAVARLKPAWEPARRARWSQRGAIAACCLVAVGTMPQYFNRYDYSRARAEALGHGAESDRIALYRWVRENAGPRDVFLASDDMGLFAVAVAGSKTLVVDPYLSNPYVDWTPRNSARRQLFDALAAGDREGFLAGAREWNISHVVVETEGFPAATRPDDAPLEDVWSAGTLRVYRIQP